MKDLRCFQSGKLQYSMFAKSNKIEPESSSVLSIRKLQYSIFRDRNKIMAERSCLLCAFHQRAWSAIYSRAA